MASSNVRSRARAGTGRNLKVVVTGPFAAGKTTFIRTISEITVLATEKSVTDATRSRKLGTTVAMDHGRISFASDLVLSLFGTPGQDRFEFMWEVLAEGMLGYVVVLDGSVPTFASDAASVSAAFHELDPLAPFVVAVNHRPSGLAATEAEVVRSALDLPDGVPVLAVDAMSKPSVKAVLLALLDEVVAVRRHELIEA